MKYLVKYKKINCILTTHFYDLCKKLDLLEIFLNCNIPTIEDEKEQFKYTYQLKNGISKVKGGMKVLRDMNYPNEIINQI
jgi:DNA mismatch repair ATPase MutS